MDLLADIIVKWIEEKPEEDVRALFAEDLEMEFGGELQEIDGQMFDFSDM